MPEDYVEGYVTITAAEKFRDKERGTRWKLSADVPMLRTNRPVGPLYADWNEVDDFMAGDQVHVKLKRGRLKGPDRDGTQDFHYHWDVLELNSRPQTGKKATETSRPVAGAPPERARPSSWNDASNTAAGDNWPLAVLGAAHLHGPAPVGGGEVDFEWVDTLAHDLYSLMGRGPSPVKGGGTPSAMGGTPGPNGSTPPEPAKRLKAIQEAVVDYNNAHPNAKVDSKVVNTLCSVSFGVTNSKPRDTFLALNPEQLGQLLRWIKDGQVNAKLTEAAGGEDDLTF